MGETWVKLVKCCETFFYRSILRANMGETWVKLVKCCEAFLHTNFQQNQKSPKEKRKSPIAEIQPYIVGLQETRMRKPTKLETEDYIVLCGCANARGHYGTQLWFSRKLPLDKAGTLYFQKEHMKILHQDPRRLCVRVRSPFMKAIVISAHAPHSQASESERQDWWQQLTNTIPARYKDWHHVAMIDANARLGEYPNGLVGDFDADVQDDNGSLFSDFLTCNGYWLPSTFEATHSGESGTWWHQQSEKWVRGDFICLSTSLPVTSCRSFVLQEIDLSLQKDDHRPVCVQLNWTTVCDTANFPEAGRQQKFRPGGPQRTLW